MNQNPMDGDITKLLKLLRKILKRHPHGPELAKWMSEQPVNLNLCFFTFVPMTPEELEEMEDMYEDYMSRIEEGHHEKPAAKLEFKLSQDDLRFLKEHGIQF